MGSNPTAMRKTTGFSLSFFNEINPFGICEMRYAHEILLRNMKCLRHEGFEASCLFPAIVGGGLAAEGGVWYNVLEL